MDVYLVVPKSSFALMDVYFSQKTFGRLLPHGSFGCFHGESFRIRCLAAPPMKLAFSLPEDACEQFCLASAGFCRSAASSMHTTLSAAARHVVQPFAAAAIVASRSLERVLRKPRRMRSMRSRRTPLRGASTKTATRQDGEAPRFFKRLQRLHAVSIGSR